MMDEKTVRLYYQKYKENGIDGLLTLKYKGREPKLTQAQTAKLENYLDETLFNQPKRLLIMYTKPSRLNIFIPVW